MPVHQKYGSFFRVFVSPLQGILTSGSTYNLAAGQIGVFDGKSYAALSAPSHFQNESIVIAQGLNPQKMPLMMGIPNSFSEKSENIVAGRILQWRAYRGKPGQSELVAVGYEGSDPTKTLNMRKNEKRSLWVRLSGAPINKIYSTDGLLLRYTVDTTETGDCCDSDCDDCGNIECNTVADILVDKINKDEGTMRHHGLIRASKKIFCTTPPSPTTTAWDVYTITIADDGSDSALGRVQAQYPGYSITRIARNAGASTSTYQMLRITSAGAPAALTTSINTYIPNCPTCPSGYTTVAATHLFEISVPAATTLSTGNITGLSGQQKTAENGTATTYLIGTTAATSIASTLTQGEAITGAQIRYVGESAVSCSLTSPTTAAWADTGNGTTQAQEYHLTIKDSECGTDYLTILIAAYASYGTVTMLTNDESTPCVHTYAISVQSQVIMAGCVTEEPVWKAPPSFMGVPWVKYYTAPSVSDGCSCGVWIEGAYVNRITNACTYGTFDYNADGIHIQVSNYNADYNAPPNTGDDWPIQHLRVFIQPTGLGAALKELEERSREVFLKRFSYDVAVRDAEGFVLFADSNTYYDQYALEYAQIPFNQSGFTESKVNKHTLNVYYPAGLGEAYEIAINSYIASNPALGIKPVSLFAP